MNLFAFITLACLYIIKPFKFVKLVRLISTRIGHLAGNTDIFLRRLQLGIIKKDGIMPVMVDTKRFGPPTKWCYVLMGQLIIKVETVNGWETHILSKDESLAFDSSQKHQFENTAKITTKAIIIQNPKLL